jgi:predicted tellurium resistance membrane protein TerC
MEFFAADNLMSFATLSLLEIVLGIDNLIFIALLVQHLPEEYRAKARYIGLGLALAMRVGMLFGATWIMSLTKPAITIMDFGLSFKDILMLAGGLFLIAKATFEMHADIAGEEEKKEMVEVRSFWGAITQIVLIDLVFSFDSVITAVGMTQNLTTIVAAVTVSMVVMLAASGVITKFLHENPTFKMLALSFIIMIGVLLVAEGFHFHVPRQYIYFAFGFSLFVEFLNTLASRRRKARRLAKQQQAAEMNACNPS